MSLKSQIETAKDAVSKALIAALENKDESAVSNLITCYNTLSDTHVKHSFAINDTISFNNMNYSPDYVGGGIKGGMGDDVISFGSPAATKISGDTVLSF
jgi:hypothetical protein